MNKPKDPVVIWFEELKRLSKFEVKSVPLGRKLEDRGRIIPENINLSGCITISRLGDSLNSILFTPQALSTAKPKGASKEGRDSRVKEERGYTPQQAIKRHCKDCAGEKPKEILLCDKADCPLWSYRFGFSINDKRFGKQMRRIWKRYPGNYAELREVVINLLKNIQNSREKARLHTLLRAIDSGAE